MKKILFLFTMCIITCRVFGQYPSYIEAQNKADMYGFPIICDSLGKPINLNIIDATIGFSFDGYISFECKLKKDTMSIDSINIKSIVDREPRAIEFCYDSIGKPILSPRAIFFQNFLREKLKNAFLVYPEKTKKNKHVFSMTISYNYRFRINSPFEEEDFSCCQ